MNMNHPLGTIAGRTCIPPEMVFNVGENQVPFEPGLVLRYLKMQLGGSLVYFEAGVLTIQAIWSMQKNKLLAHPNSFTKGIREDTYPQ